MSDADWTLVRLKQDHVELAIDVLADVGSPAAAEAARLLRRGPTTAGRYRLRSDHVEMLLGALKDRPSSRLVKTTRKRLREATAVVARDAPGPEDRQHELVNDATLHGERKRVRHVTGRRPPQH